MKVCIILISFCFLCLQIVEAQRGGGSSHSHSSSRHSSSRSRSSYHFRSYYPSPYTSQIDYATSLWDDLYMLIIAVGSFLGVGVFAAIISNYLEKKKMKRQWELFKSGHTIKNQNIDVDAMIQKIKEQYWRMEYKIDVERDSEPHPVQIHTIEISNQKGQSQNELELHLKGNDSVGSWEGNGIIKFAEPIILQFKKNYLNKEQAGQTGKWKDLIYEGIFQEQEQMFLGKWYYIGLEQDQQFSGVWQIQLVEK